MDEKTRPGTLIQLRSCDTMTPMNSIFIVGIAALALLAAALVRTYWRRPHRLVATALAWLERRAGDDEFPQLTASRHEESRLRC